jgi:hypothetical protein
MLDDLRSALHRLDRQAFKTRDAKPSSGEVNAGSREEEENASRQHGPSVPASAGAERVHKRIE